MSISYSLYSTGPQFGTFITIICLFFTANEGLSFQTVFTSMFLIREVSNTFCSFIPNAISLGTDVYVSLQRIQEFLERNYHVASVCEKSHGKRYFQENDQQFDSFDNKSDRADNIQCSRVLTDHLTREEVKTNNEKSFLAIPYLNLCDVTCKHHSPLATSDRVNFKNLPLLNYITLNVSGRGLVLITGLVGSGKSSLLACVLDGELLLTNGIVEFYGNLAYVSDTPCIFPTTIRENILFGLPYNQEWYLETVKACQLEKDFNDFPKGDLSRVGEHGATVSGGQQTRIALARAVYSKADIYLLDDPLSSLDAKVAENIFGNCIRGLLSDRIVLLTTRTTRYLEKADHVVKLKGGVVVAQGKFDEIKDQFSGIECGEVQLNVTLDKELSGTHQDNECEEVVQSETMQGEMLRETKEDRVIGNVSLKVYWEYFVNGASPFILILVALVFVAGQGLTVLVNIYVSNLPKLFKQEGFGHQAIITYSLMLAIALFLTIVGTLAIFLVLINASYTVHNKMVACLKRAPISFFVTNPIGRIMNRFSQDINNLDELLPRYLIQFCQNISPTLVSLVLAPMANTILIPLSFVSALGLYFISRFYLRCALDLKRLMLIAASPLYSHFSNTMEGVRIIRVHNRQNEFTDEVYSQIDSHDQALFAYYTSMGWFANTLDILCVVYTAIVSTAVVISITDSSNIAFGAVTILYAIKTVVKSQFTIKLFTEVHSQMTSAERTLAYTKINAEKGQDVKKKPAGLNWPHSGAIQFKNVSLWYYEDGPKVLKNLSLEIKASEKIGIAGRTGAGKSSLAAALMRMAETDGKIIVDDINIMKFNVVSTRRNISIISQSPILISGSIRVNLDPSGMFTDSDIWDALEQMQIKSVISRLPQQLESLIIGSSSSFSVGEIQLLHLARVLLKKSKIIIFDEATGKVDEKTDEIIQKIIRKVFKDCTVITIAHRLSTILDCDRIMVLDRGEIVEFDKPDILLKKKDGILQQLCKIS